MIRSSIRSSIKSIASGLFTTAEGFLPSNIDNLLFWTKAENEPRTSWNTAGFQLDNEANASLNAKGFSGGYVDLESANSDYVDTGVSFSASTGYEGLFLFKINTVTGTYVIYDGRDANDDGIIFFLNASDQIQFSHNTTDLITTGTYNDNAYHWVHFKWDGADVTVTFYDANGVQEEQLTDTDATSISTAVSGYIAQRRISSGLYFNGQIAQAIVRTNNSTFDLEDLITTPNTSYSTVSGYDGILFAYDFSEGIIENGNPIIDYSGNDNHGTFVTSAAGAYDAAGNDAEVGYQTALSAFSLYDYFDGVDDQIQLPSTFTMGVGEYVELAGIVHDPSAGSNIVTLFENIGINPDLVRFGSDGQALFRINTTVYVHATSCNVGYNILRLTRSSSSQYTLTINGTDEVFSESSAIVLELGQYNSTVFWSGLVDYYDINGTIYSSRNGFSGATVSGSPTKRRILSPDGTTDQFGNPVQYDWTAGKFNGWGGFHGGIDPINLGGSQTVAFGIKVADASVNQTIFESGTPADITINTSDITCASFSTITVDGAASQTLSDNTWHVVELQNATDVDLDAFEISAGFDGELVFPIVYADQLNAAESANIKAYIESKQ